LIVEDNKADVFLICEAIQSANLNADLHVVSDGEKALRFFEQVDLNDSMACPALVILDINLPKKPGGQVLQQMRTSRKCGKAPVLVVTSSDSARDRDLMATLGVSGYFRKPSGYDDFMKLGQLVKGLLDQGPEDLSPQ
jgi:DNA-binding response OmpR family regulator